MIKVRIEKEYAVEKQKEEKSVHETNQYDDYAFPVGVYRVKVLCQRAGAIRTCTGMRNCS